MSGFPLGYLLFHSSRFRHGVSLSQSLEDAVEDVGVDDDSEELSVPLDTNREGLEFCTEVFSELTDSNTSHSFINTSYS